MSEIQAFQISDEQSDGLRFATAVSTALGRRADLTLYASPGAGDGAPLVVLLHGIFGSHWNWALLGGAHNVLRALVAEGRVRPMILAMPSDGLWGAGSGYIGEAETWIRDEVPAVARLAYPGTGPTAIAGLSMGGFGALRLAAKDPDLYVAAAGTSSVTRLAQLRNVASLVPEEDERLVDAIVGAGNRMPPFRLDCGLADHLLEANRRLHRALEDAGIPHEYHEFEGGHDWSYWPDRLAEILVFFEQTLGHTGGR